MLDHVRTGSAGSIMMEESVRGRLSSEHRYQIFKIFISDSSMGAALGMATISSACLSVSDTVERIRI